MDTADYGRCFVCLDVTDQDICAACQAAGWRLQLHQHTQDCYDSQGRMRCGRVAGVDDEIAQAPPVLHLGETHP